MPLRSDGKKTYWKSVWKQAFNNMPFKTRTVIYEPEWKRAKKPMPIGDYIKGVAEGTVQMIDNKPHVIYVREEVVKYGQQSALTKIMGFHKPRCRNSCLCHNRVRNGIDNGTKLTDEDQRQLLLKLAGPRGKELALKILASKKPKKGDQT